MATGSRSSTASWTHHLSPTVNHSDSVTIAKFTFTATRTASQAKTLSESDSIPIPYVRQYRLGRIIEEASFAAAPLVAIVGVPFIGVHVGLAAYRASIGLRVAACDWNRWQDELEWSVSWTQLSYGEKPYLYGAVTGNLVLLVGLLIVSVLAVVIKYAVHPLPRGTLTGAAASITMPGMFFAVIITLTSAPMALLGTVLSRYYNRNGDLIAGAAAFLSTWVVGLIVLYRMTKGFYAKAEFVGSNVRSRADLDKDEVERRRGYVRELFVSPYTWHNDGEDSTFVERYGVLFRTLRIHRHWFVSIDVAFTTGCGIMGGLIPSGCDLMRLTLFAAAVLLLLILIALRPFQCTFDTVVMLAHTFILAVVAGVARLHEDAVIPATILAVVHIWLFSLLMLMDLVFRFVFPGWRNNDIPWDDEPTHKPQGLQDLMEQGRGGEDDEQGVLEEVPAEPDQDDRNIIGVLDTNSNKNDSSNSKIARRVSFSEDPNHARRKDHHSDDDNDEQRRGNVLTADQWSLRQQLRNRNLVLQGVQARQQHVLGVLQRVLRVPAGLQPVVLPQEQELRLRTLVALVCEQQQYPEDVL